MDQARAVDPCGRFRVALVLARSTGRRLDAILHLKLSDVLLSRDRVVTAQAAVGLDERDVKSMPFRAIRWRAEHDKQGAERITPVSPELRDEIEAYLYVHPRVGDLPLPSATAIRGDSPDAGSLLPHDRDDVVHHGTATKWLEKAERLAELPKLAGGGWHAYRRLWASERASAQRGRRGSGRLEGSQLAYQHATPDGVAAAVFRIKRA